MPAEWSPDLILNDETLDREHVDLFRQLEATAAALEGDRSILDRAVETLGETLGHHLAREERMMELLAYPERVRHRMAHELFRADFERMRSALRASGPDAVVAEWLTTRIPEWLRFHIRVNDAPLAHWFAQRTRKPEPHPSPTPGARRRSRPPDRRS
jgi:hemerythrin